MNQVTALLDAAAGGDRQAAAELLPLVYDELRRLAAVRMSAERPDHTLNATSLVHEAYLRLVGDQKFDHRGHFFVAAAESMRRILVESARRKRRLRHGGDFVRVDLGQAAVVYETEPIDMLALDEALGLLAGTEPAAAEVVKLRYFAGLTIAQAAAALGISVRTANRDWAFAKAWLYRQLSTPEKIAK